MPQNRLTVSTRAKEILNEARSLCPGLTESQIASQLIELMGGRYIQLLSGGSSAFQQVQVTTPVVRSPQPTSSSKPKTAADFF